MFDATATEFPFVEALPKREKSKLAKVWEMLAEFSDAQKREGALVPVMLAARVLDLSRTRIDQICEDGRLRRVVVDGHVFISEASILSFARSCRVHGRPRKASFTFREALESSREMVKEYSSKKA